MVEYLDYDEGRALRLTPNRSLSWQGNVIFFGLIALVTLMVAIGWSLAGAWMVLPFAGVELAVVAYGLYYTSRQCHRQEVVVLTADTVRLEKGVNRKESEWTLPRHWARIIMEMPRHGFAVPRLMLAYHDTRVPLADCLNPADLEEFLGVMEDAGVRVERHYPAGGRWF
ncbi:DUF2244 domain-containing protein [Salicola sp. Rm-C-2C1-2]|uniref:DUF2244 domain-containing protein n=1 Tax=Salicola sp. Rm-C-2C1-2 TaxID=3141321 RepID=UPI0032E49A2E